MSGGNCMSNRSPSNKTKLKFYIMNKKSILLPSLALAGVCMGFSFTSCDEESRNELINDLIGQAIEYLVTDSTSFMTGKWAAVDPSQGIYDTVSFTTMTNGRGEFREHIINGTTEDYIEVGSYDFHKTGKEMIVYIDKTIVNKYEGKDYGGTELYNEDEQGNRAPEVRYYKVSKFKMRMTEAFDVNQITLGLFDSNAGSPTYGTVIEETTFQAVR